MKLLRRTLLLWACMTGLLASVACQDAEQGGSDTRSDENTQSEPRKVETAFSKYLQYNKVGRSLTLRASSAPEGATLTIASVTYASTSVSENSPHDDMTDQMLKSDKGFTVNIANDSWKLGVVLNADEHRLTCDLILSGGSVWDQCTFSRETFCALRTKFGLMSKAVFTCEPGDQPAAAGSFNQDLVAAKRKSCDEIRSRQIGAAAASPTAEICECGVEAISLFDDAATEAKFRASCQTGFSHLKTLRTACQELISAGKVTNMQESSCTCTNGKTVDFSVKFDSELRIACGAAGSDDIVQQTVSDFRPFEQACAELQSQHKSQVECTRTSATCAGDFLSFDMFTNRSVSEFRTECQDSIDQAAAATVSQSANPDAGGSSTLPAMAE